MHKYIFVYLFDCVSNTKHKLGMACFQNLLYMRSILNRASEIIHSNLIIVQLIYFIHCFDNTLFY